MEDKLFDFIELCKKKISIDKICESLEISKLEALGLKNEAKERGFNIVTDQNEEGLFFYNQGELNESKEDIHEFKTDDGHNFRFMAISNTLLGSKSQQLSVLRDIYKKAKEQGVTAIFLCGNISAGTNAITSPYFDSNFIPDTEGQIDYIIENYPREEGITTYFITGKKEDKSKISVGNRIAAARPDMVYLGSTSSDVKVDGVKIKIICSPVAQTYTTSYRPQQFAKSFRSEDKPDILLLGGLNQLDHITYREVCVLTAPSVCATTKEMEDQRKSNTVGAIRVDIHTDEDGKLNTGDGVVYTVVPYYVTDKDDYKRKTKAPIVRADYTKSDKDDELGRATVNKFFNRIKNGKSVEEFKANFHLSDAELMGIIELCNMYGKSVSIVLNEEGVPVFSKGLPADFKLRKPGLNSSDIVDNHFLVVSDTHLCNNHQQLHILNELYQEAYDRGITDVLHVGDVVDGFYPNRKPYPAQQFLYDFNDQAEYVINMYPKVDGITTYYITGNHDMTHYRNGGASIDHWIGKDRPDMVHLGQDLGEIKFDKVKYRLDHPADGSTDSLSYKVQKRIEIIRSGDKPNIYLCGHYHKSYYMLYRNVHAFTCPAVCATTSFEQGKGLINYLGGFFLHVYSNKKTGSVEYIEIEEKLYGKKDLWDEAGKDKGKVKQLVIK